MQRNAEVGLITKLSLFIKLRFISLDMFMHLEYIFMKIGLRENLYGKFAN